MNYSFRYWGNFYRKHFECKAEHLWFASYDNFAKFLEERLEDYDTKKFAIKKKAGHQDWGIDDVIVLDLGEYVPEEKVKEIDYWKASKQERERFEKVYGKTALKVCEYLTAKKPVKMSNELWQKQRDAINGYMTQHSIPFRLIKKEGYVILER